MTHQRTIIRNRLREILVAANVAGGNVRNDGLLVETLALKDLPALGIWMMDDEVTAEDPGPRRRTREVMTLFRGVVVPGDDVQDKLDQLERDVMDVLDADRYLGGNPRQYTNNVRLDGVSISLISIGQQVTGYIEIGYVMEYLDYAPEFEIVTNPFQTLDTTYNINGNTDPGNQPGDRQTFPGGP